MILAKSNKRGKNPFLKTKLTVAAIVLLILALGFNALLISSSLEKLYVESLVSSYQVIGKDFRRNIEKALRFGKSIKKFVGINARLESTLHYMTRQDASKHGGVATEKGSRFHRYVAVALPDGKILYSTDEKLIGSALPEKADIDYGRKTDEKGAPKEWHSVKHKNTYLITLPIRGRNQKWIATTILAFDENQVKTLLKSAWRQNLKAGFIILICGTFVLFLILNMILPRERSKIKKVLRAKTGFAFKEERHTFPRRKISILLLLVIIFCQVGSSTFSTNAFKDYYLNINKEKSVMLNTLLKDDIEYLLRKGLRLHKLFKMEVMMGEILSHLPEVSDISILGKEENLMYMADQEGVVNFMKNIDKNHIVLRHDLPELSGEYNVRIKIMKDGKAEGYISTNISKKVVLSRLREIILDSATVLVISILFSVELLIMISQFLQKQDMGAPEPKKIHYGAMRPAVFFFLFGIDVSISFLPLYMEELYKPIFGLSKDMVIGLPISVEMFFVGISLFIAGVWLDRRGWLEPFFSGLFLAGAGVLYSWLAPSALQFIISRGVVGLGFGFSLMASQGFVISHSDEKRKAQALAHLFAGVYAGSICGGAAGAMLAERIGYNPVFFLGAVIVFLVIAYTIVFLRSDIRQPRPRAAEQPVQSIKIGQIIRYIFNRNIFCLLFLSALPAAVAVVGFLNYFSPIYLNRIGASQSNIGRIFMIYGVCLIYVAPFISKYVDESENKKAYIILSGILGSLALLTFYFFGGLAATAFTVLMLGLAGSFDASRAYALKLKATQQLGEGKAMGVFNSAGRIGQVIGPIAFGWLTIALGISKGIAYFGLAYLLAIAFFFILAQTDKKVDVT